MNIPKLEDANDAGGPHSLECTLILTEGDSAKATAVAGLGVVGRDKFGVFPLRGKMLNVRTANHKMVSGNAEVQNLLQIIGLKYKPKDPNAKEGEGIATDQSLEEIEKYRSFTATCLPPGIPLRRKHS